MSRLGGLVLALTLCACGAPAYSVQEGNTDAPLTGETADEYGDASPPGKDAGDAVDVPRRGKTRTPYATSVQMPTFRRLPRRWLTQNLRLPPTVPTTQTAERHVIRDSPISLSITRAPAASTTLRICRPHAAARSIATACSRIFFAIATCSRRSRAPSTTRASPSSARRSLPPPTDGRRRASRAQGALSRRLVRAAWERMASGMGAPQARAHSRTGFVRGEHGAWLWQIRRRSPDGREGELASLLAAAAET